MATVTIKGSIHIIARNRTSLANGAVPPAMNSFTYSKQIFNTTSDKIPQFNIPFPQSYPSTIPLTDTTVIHLLSSIHLFQGL
jgi:hypothetical protein